MNRIRASPILDSWLNLWERFWSTPFSQPRGGGLFSRNRAARRDRYLGGILSPLDCQPIIIGGTEDHVHLLGSLSRTCEAAMMVKELKRGSSVWLKTKGPELQDFAWQKGYGIFSIGHSQIEATRNYIAKQEEHHQRVSFQDEFRQLLQRYEDQFDERYLWD